MKRLSVTLRAAACCCCCAAAVLVGGGCSSGGTAPYDPGAPGGGPTPAPTPSPGATPGPPDDAGPLTPPFAGKIAFFSRRGADEREALYVMNPDGSRVTPVPLNGPTGAPLNLRIKFAGNRFMNAGGTHFVLTVLGLLAGSATEGRTYLVNADGSDPREITALLDPTAAGQPYSTRVRDVSMNADGSRLVFAYGGSGATGGGVLPPSIVSMRPDGGERTVRYTAPSATRGVYAPAFAPDGATIYYLEEASAATRDGGVPGATHVIRRIDPGSGEPAVVTGVVDTSGPGQLFTPSVGVSPDGTLLTFASEENGDSEIFTVRAADGTARTRLTSSPGADEYPAITTDGAKIVFASDRDGNREIYSMNLDGTGVARLTFDATTDEEPATRAGAGTRAGAVREEQGGAK